MVKYLGLCRPLGEKVEFTVDAVNAISTSRGKKWQVKGHYDTYNISTFTSEKVAHQLIEEMEGIKTVFDAEISHISSAEVYEMEELMPFAITWDAEELKREEEDTPIQAEPTPSSGGSYSVSVQDAEENPYKGLPKKYLKKNGTPDMRYKICREWLKGKETAEENQEESPSLPEVKIEKEIKVRDNKVEVVDNLQVMREDLKPNTLTIPKTIYYEMIDIIPNTVTANDTPDGTSVTLGFLEFDSPLIESIFATGLPPNEEEVIVMDAESNEPIFNMDAEELTDSRAEQMRNIFMQEAEDNEGEGYHSKIVGNAQEKHRLIKENIEIIFKEKGRPLYDYELLDELIERDTTTGGGRQKNKRFNNRVITRMINSDSNKYYRWKNQIHYIGDKDKRDYIMSLSAEDKVVDRHGNYDELCDWCGGIENPSSERGPYKSRHLCDCNDDVDEFDAEDDLKLKTIQGGLEVYTGDMESAEDKDQKAYFRGVVAAFDGVIRGIKRHGMEITVEEIMAVLLPKAIGNFTKLQDAGLMNQSYYYNAGKISGYEECADFLNPFGMEFMVGMSAEEKELKFRDWADEELDDENHGGGQVTFDDWLDEEIKEHGDVTLSEWKKDEHEEKAHQAETKYFDSEVKNLLDNYVLTIYPNNGDAQDKLMNDILSGKVEVSLEKMKATIENKEELPDWEDELPEWEEDYSPQEEDIYEDIEWESESTPTKPLTLATMLGLGALAAALAPREIRELFRRMGK